MSVAIYDADMNHYVQCPFNLEVMKLASYYTKKHEIVSLARELNPNFYTKFIYRKDYQNEPVPSEILRLDNVEYGGRAFNKEIYIPLPEEIEAIKANTEVYQTFRKDYIDTVPHQEEFKLMLNAQHARLSLDSNTIWNNYEKQLDYNENINVIMLHDYNLNTISGAHDEIKDLLKRYKKNSDKKFLATKFPIIVQTPQDLLRWSEFPVSKIFMIQYNGFIPNEVILDYSKMDKTRGTQIATKYNIAAAYDSEFAFAADLENIYLQTVFIKNLRLRINYTWPQSFFSNEIYEYILELFNNYINSTADIPNDKYDSTYKDRLVLFCKSVKFDYLKNRTNPKKIKMIFDFVKEFNYNLYRMFYDTSFVELKGGILTDVTTRN